jgi:integrase
LFIIKSGSAGNEELFTFHRLDGSEVPLRSRTIRDELKKTCELHGLPPAYFSSHSLRKGAITHMRAAGATEEDRRDRGNNAAGSQVMNQIYDYAVGLGPLASNSLPGGRRLGLRDVKRLIPATRKSV